MKGDGVEIQVDVLKKVCEILFRHLEQTGRSVVEIPVDYYMNELQKLLNQNKETIAYQFVWLAAILRTIGEHEIS